jgi:4'-phosphopantetheinyl transferase
LARLPGCTRAILNLSAVSSVKRLAVHSWPLSTAQIEALKPDLNLLVISLVVPKSAARELARIELRAAVTTFLAALYKLAPSAISITSIAGQPLHVSMPIAMPKLYLSLSHQPGLSLAVLDWLAPVGIDLMQVPQDFDWHTLAKDYLGQAAYKRIASEKAAQQMIAFSHEWTRLEAGLKCLGLGLEEWRFALDLKIQSCQFSALQLPTGFVGTLARAQSLPFQLRTIE